MLYRAISSAKTLVNPMMPALLAEIAGLADEGADIYDAAVLLRDHRRQHGAGAVVGVSANSFLAVVNGPLNASLLDFVAVAMGPRRK
jgi:hypothetical protein